jgi:predicted methyltransferase
MEHNEPKSNQKQNILKEVVEDILKIITEEHGQIALNSVLELACQKSNKVKEFLKDEKLTARDSRKVRNIFVEINRHPNIKVVKKNLNS